MSFSAAIKESSITEASITAEKKSRVKRPRTDEFFHVFIFLIAQYKKMSECSICRNLTKDNFDQKTSVFTSRRAVLYSLLNTLLTIKKYRGHLCYSSQREQKCTICDITNEFYRLEYDLYENMLNFHFLNQIHRRLFMHLNKMFASNRCFCLILNNKFANI